MGINGPAGRERGGIWSQNADEDEIRAFQSGRSAADYDERGPIDGQMPYSDEFGSEYEDIDAATTNMNRPRARKLGYNARTKTLVIVFWDFTWCVYSDVPNVMWRDLKSTDSTGKYLKLSGLDDWDYYTLDNKDPNSLPRTKDGEFRQALSQR